MKTKKDNIDKAELVIDPTTIYGKLPTIKEQVKKIGDYSTHLTNSLNTYRIRTSKDMFVDENLNRKETIQALKKHLNALIEDFSIITSLEATARERLYNFIINASIVVYDTCQRIRNSGYSYHATKYLAWAITNMESNVVLSGVKFIRERMKLYFELASCYEDLKSFKCSFKVVSQAMLKLSNLRAIEEQQQSLPTYINIALVESMRLMKSLELKYGVLVSQFNIKTKYNELILIILYIFYFYLEWSFKFRHLEKETR
jgi:hypothetical protein